MFVLTCHITIGSATFKSVTDVVIKRSTHASNATAVIKVPVTAVLRQEGKEPTKVETAQQINVGDAVSIKLGYDGKLKEEFKGFVKRLNYTVPLEIECEDWYWKLRYTTIKKSYPEATVKQLLNDVLSGSGASVHPATIDLGLKNTVINNKTGAWVLEKLKSDYGLTVFFSIDGQCFAGKAYEVQGAAAKYKLRWNVLKDDDLKYYRAEDYKLKVEAKTYDRDGAKLEATVGSEGGEVKTLWFYNVTDKAQLKTLAEQELQRYSFDGYRGKIETFLIPFAEPGMIAEVEDPLYKVYGGSYYIESTEVHFGTGGGRRKVELGIKL
ncbi:hypothetical protein [uncultured Draconibacterium sp.]|uniref:hypothetical protein n=1 Tax=uncultured Draconibacterium sp. TaxID=1573823 RepID=UPI0025DF4E72|nr:hypothetical protein [uncultured Draconibacterium sp.]